MTSTSLVYRSLDAQVIAGHADDSALSSGTGTMSYAQLLHESASIAGALAQLEIQPGTPVVLDGLDEHLEVVAVLALARVGAVPSSEGAVRLTGRPPVLSIGDQDPVAWDVLLHAGRVDPAPAPVADAPGYEEALLGAYEDVFTTLLDGGTVG